MKPSMVLLVAISLVLAGCTGTSVTTQRYDNYRTGANLSETTLTDYNVGDQLFGKLFACPVEGDLYAQPLVVAGITMPDNQKHNVMYAVTADNDAYAFDADGPISCHQYWHVCLGTWSSSGQCTGYFSGNNISTNIPGGHLGILSTPVIDPSTSTMYIVAETATSTGGAEHKLHALDPATGAEKFGGPTLIAGTFPGTAPTQSAPGVVLFESYWQLQRPALLLLNGKVYIAFGSIADQAPWHGWIFAYAANNLTQPPLIWLSSPNRAPINGDLSGASGGASIWQAGSGPAADANGNIYVMTGNGYYATPANSATPGNYGDSFVQLDANLGGHAEVVLSARRAQMRAL